MLYEAQALAGQREGYPSGKWRPEAELVSKQKTIRPCWNKAFFLETGILACLIFLAMVPVTLLDKYVAWVKFIVVPGALVVSGGVAIRRHKK